MLEVSKHQSSPLNIDYWDYGLNKMCWTPKLVTLIHIHNFQEEAVFRANKQFRRIVFADSGSADTAVSSQ